MTVISMVRDQAAVDSVQHAIGLVTSTYSTCTPSDFTLLRETLAAHFQDKKVKVSLFLQDGIQKDDGTFVLDTRGPPPPNAEAPGEIRYSDGTVQVIDVPTRDHAAQGRVGMVLGGNVYAKDRPPPPPAPAPAPASASVGGGAPARSGPLGDPSAVRTHYSAVCTRPSVQPTGSLPIWTSSALAISLHKVPSASSPLCLATAANVE
jgi:hypothetical protein